MTVITGSVLLTNHPIDFPRRPGHNLWNSEICVMEQYAAFGASDSKLSLYTRWAWKVQRPWPRSSECKNERLNLWDIHCLFGHLVPCIWWGQIKNPKFSTDRSQYCLYQIHRNLPAEINCCWLNSQVNQTRKEWKMEV